MRKCYILSLILATILLCACSPDPTSENINGTALKFSSDGAWCWFQDPRSVYISGNAKRTYAGWVTKDGKLQVGAYDHSTGKIEKVTIREKWGADDHNANSFLVLPDNRIMIFYTRHDSTGLYSRTTLNPEDIRKWSDEIMVSNTRRITYSHPVYLRDEKRIYLFWRGESRKPTFSTSTDGFAWTAPQILFQDSGRERLNVRPYLKVTSDGLSDIHFAFTDGHPNREPENSIYYIKYKKGIFTKANGTLVGTMSDLPIQHRYSDIVYDGMSSKVRSWVWDISVNETGNPVIAYTRFPEKNDHRYHYAYWDDNTWLDSEITPGGGWFPETPMFAEERETYYSGGMAINQSNPNVVYLSREIDKIFEIERWETRDHGNTWFSCAITSDSKYNNVRPVVPKGRESNVESVLWMQGEYIHFTDYDTKILMLKPHSYSAQKSSAADARAPCR